MIIEVVVRNKVELGHDSSWLLFLTLAGDILETLKTNGYTYSWGDVTVKLAKAYGFCWGVERAVQIAYEARRQFPEERLWITNEIIHNPTVNKVCYSLCSDTL